MKYFFWFFLLFLCPLLMSQEKQKEKGVLVVNIDGLQNNKGKVMVALDNSKENFSSSGSVYKGANAVIKEKKATVTFSELPYGLYAVKVFHDENNNNELDSNIMGIPQEAYGFSNNARGSFGPASWEDACFEINNDSLVISITVE